MQKINSALPGDLKESKFFTRATGGDSGPYYVEVDLVRSKSPGNYGAEALARVEQVDFTYYNGETSRTTVRAFHKDARDCDHDLFSTFYAEFTDFQINYMDFGVIEGHAYLTELRAFAKDQAPEIEYDDEPCARCNEKHGYVESYLPPKVKALFPAPSVRHLVRIRLYPTNAFSVENKEAEQDD
jgi:hypothetical protein